MNTYLYTLLVFLFISQSLAAMDDAAPLAKDLHQSDAQLLRSLERLYQYGKQYYYSNNTSWRSLGIKYLVIVANNNQHLDFIADAQIILGQIHLYGLHRYQQNPIAALKCFCAASLAENLKDAYKARLYIARMYAEGHFGVTDFSSAQESITLVHQGLSSLDSRTQQMLQAHTSYLQGLIEVHQNQNPVAAQKHFQSVLTNPLAGGQTKFACQQLLQQLAPQEQ